MIENILKVGATFDWITPVAAVIKNATLGEGAYMITVPFGVGWSGADVVRLLRGAGIETWGHMVVNDQVCVTIRRSKLKYAGKVLDRAGVPWS